MQKTILIVDDEKNLVELIRYNLTAKGYSAVTAVSGLEGLAKLKVLKPDLIILDVNMPGMNGLDFYRKVTTDYGRARYPILVLTSRAELEQTFRDIEAAGFLPKPFLIEDLIAEVERILSGFIKPAVFLIDFADNIHTDRIKDLLARQEYEPLSIKSGAHLKDAVRDRQPVCVILEYGQSEMNGARLIREIRGIPSLKLTPVIAYSYSGYKEYERESLSAGADKYLAAPGKYEEFLTALREIELGRKS